MSRKTHTPATPAPEAATEAAPEASTAPEAATEAAPEASTAPVSGSMLAAAQDDSASGDGGAGPLATGDVDTAPEADPDALAASTLVDDLGAVMSRIAELGDPFKDVQAATAELSAANDELVRLTREGHLRIARAKSRLIDTRERVQAELEELRLLKIRAEQLEAANASAREAVPKAPAETVTDTPIPTTAGTPAASHGGDGT